MFNLSSLFSKGPQKDRSNTLLNNTSLHGKSIMAKTVEVGSSTLLSRLLGLAREMLMARYLGSGILADAFITAFKIPNSLRKIFAEGALSAAFIPTFVKLIKQNKKTEASSLLTLSFIVFEGALLCLCLLIFWQAPAVIQLIAPGWYTCTTSLPNAYWHGTLDCLNSILQFFYPSKYACYQAAPQAIYAIIYLRILIAFILFLSSSALLAGALQAVNHFFVPAFSPVLLNIVFIGSLGICMLKNLPVEFFCYSIIFGGLLQFLLHVWAYFKLHFTFAAFDLTAIKNTQQVLKKFLPAAFSMSVMEINLFVSTSLASYLPQGSIALIHYANRFMGIPLGVFSTAFSTILFPHLSRISTYAPQRLNFYLLESAKLIFWVTAPLTFLMSFFSEQFFITLFLSKKFGMAQVHETHYIFIAFVSGLFFFSLNKILLNMYYALHSTTIPAFISIGGVGANFILSKLWLPLWGTVGLAIAYTCSEIIRTILFSVCLYKFFNFTFYVNRFMKFVTCAGQQLLVAIILFLICYYAIVQIVHLLPQNISHFLLVQIGFWLWAGPLSLIFFVFLLWSRKTFNVHIYFLE